MEIGTTDRHRQTVGAIAEIPFEHRQSVGASLRDIFLEYLIYIFLRYLKYICYTSFIDILNKSLKIACI